MGDKALYNDLYNMDDETHDRFVLSYMPLFQRVTEIVSSNRMSPVLEVGCGRGVLAELMIAAEVEYFGFDFNEIAVEKAKKRNGADRHFVADATNARTYALPYNGIVCCEVLEHIDEDLGVMELWRPGCTCVCSVPNFDYQTHVRFFRSESEITARYDRLLEFARIERIAKSPKTGITWQRYFQRLRWSRNDPKSFLGHLGINRFEWYSGWFVFVAKRR